MADNTNMGRELGWDDEIERDSEFTLLPEGDYDFEVISFERARHAGSTKLPACNKAVLTLEVGGDQAAARIRHNLFLHTKTEGMLCAFFLGIGARKHGEKVSMDWNRVVGARGRCKLGIRKWISDKSGEEMQSNEIKRFYEPEMAQAAPAPAANAPTYVQGRF